MYFLCLHCIISLNQRFYLYRDLLQKLPIYFLFMCVWFVYYYLICLLYIYLFFSIPGVESSLEVLCD